MLIGMKPDLTDIDVYYHAYLEQVTEPTLEAGLAVTRDEVLRLRDQVPSDREDHRYADGKWSIKEVAQHIVDCERVYTYRALRFARGDELALSGFDENDWASHSRCDDRPLATILDEFDAVRRSTAAFFASLHPDLMGAHGVANGLRMTVAGYGYLACAHSRHHARVVRERYLGDG